MMRIVHIANEIKQKPVRETKRAKFSAMLATQKMLDREKALAKYIERIKKAGAATPASKIDYLQPQNNYRYDKFSNSNNK
jgi:hypothetical protein